MVRVATITLLMACLAGVGCADIQVDAQTTLSERIRTVATVEWDVATTDASGGYVEFGVDDVAERKARAWIDGEGHARAVLMGMKPLREYEYRVVEQRDGKRFESKKYALTTGALDSELPELSVPVHDAERASDGFAVTSLLGQVSVPVIIDADGEIVWSHRPALDWSGINVLRVTHSQVGEWVIYNALQQQEEGVTDPQRMIVRVSLDGEREAYYPVQDAHHDFFELSDGSLVVLEYEWRTVDGEPVRGDRLVEVSIDGSRRVVWSVWDHFEYDPELELEAGSGWSHANALDYVRQHGAYYVSLRNFSAIVKIDRATGELMWTLGGASSDFRTASGSTDLFRHQHQFTMVDDGIVVFDNGLGENGDSRAVEYRLDETAGTAELVWEHHNDPPLFCAVLGDVHRLRNGNTLITWSGLGQMDEVTPQGEVIWRLNSRLGNGFGFTRWRQVLFDVVHADLPVGALDWTDANLYH